MKNCLILTILSACFYFSPLSLHAQKKYNGTFSNGYTGGKISFVLSKDGKEIKDLTFNGHWRCSGSVEQITAGPEKPIKVNNGLISSVVTEPENGGASAFRFAINGTIKANQASGTFRMSITGLSCDTYELKWTAKN